MQRPSERQCRCKPGDGRLRQAAGGARHERHAAAGRSRWYQRRDGDVRAWLFTILHNLAINQFRQSASRGRHVPIDETNEDNFGEAAAQEQKLMYQDVLNKLAKLPEDQRAVLLLVAVEDLSYADAAKVLNIPVGTVMSRLSRARERLQQEIEGAADDTPKNVVPIRSVKNEPPADHGR